MNTTTTTASAARTAAEIEFRRVQAAVHTLGSLPLGTSMSKCLLLGAVAHR